MYKSIYIIEAMSQQSSISTPTLDKYSIFTSRMEAEDAMNEIKRNLRATVNKSDGKLGIRINERRVDCYTIGSGFPLQYWVIKEKLLNFKD